ncbi:hypothetical protein [Neobacillus sp. PS3-40]|uniref:hypothetical protein n=1 Tax=Neobacillus sp. PS3-40 TaxID=3070679 RepID=UPI0027DF8CCF|nr:hypothetical protein [Neobacillus sp. PS3-40]WML44067.1 hypothetical protein RCG20_20170 [Neobacillus sp. PS3-40]
MEKDKIKVTMTLDSLENIVYQAAYKASRKANQDMFNGLMPFISRLYDENEMMTETLNYLKDSAQSKQIEKVEIDYDLLANKVAEEMKDALCATIEYMKEEKITK